jgi:predicted dehydrogenase
MSVKVGVVGAGRIGEHHIRNYTSMPHAEVVGIYDIDYGKAERKAAAYKTTPFKDLPGLLGEVDAVSVCVPTENHADVVEEVAANRVDVLLEKPISSSLEDADRIIKAAEKAGMILMLGHVERFNPAVLTVKDIMDPGEVVYIEAQRIGPFEYAYSDTGVVLDLMIHDIDIVMHLIGSDIVKVNSMTQKVRSKTEDVAHAQLKFENGMVAVLEASRVANRRIRSMSVTQKEQYITADYQTQEVFVRSGLSAEYVGGKNVSYKQVGAMEIPYIQRGEPLRNELEHFVDCVAKGLPPGVTGEEARDALKVALQIVAEGG